MKTARQILKEAPMQRVGSAKDWKYSEETILKAMGDYAYQFQEQKSICEQEKKWISVKDKMPKHFASILGFTNSRRKVITWVDKGTGEFDIQDINDNEHFTHWQELPSNPK